MCTMSNSVSVRRRSTRKFYCVLDTETVGDAHKVFDLGYMVMDNRGRIYESGSFIVAEQIDNIDGIAELKNDRFTGKKAQIYFDDLINYRLGFDVAPFANIRTEVNNIIRDYDATLCAYRIDFDINVLNKTSRFYCGTDFFDTMPELLDIWNAAMSTLCGHNYVRFIAENDITTAKGNPQTGAEAVYRFITDNPNFEECHTALEDCKIECEILARCFKTHKKMSRGIVGVCLHNADWRRIVAMYRELIG